MQTGALREKVVISNFLVLMCAGLLILAVLTGSGYGVTEMIPEFFSVDPCSPIVTTHGNSAADLFDPMLYGGAPPPAGTCRTAGALGLDPNDNVDAISFFEIFFPEPVWTEKGTRKLKDGTIKEYWIANAYFWSVDRNSNGRSMGDFLALPIVPSGISPVLDETTSGDSACGDVFWQIFDQVAPPAQVRMNAMYYEEVDLEETAGLFGADGLDELDALERHCEDDDRYFFSVDPCTAARLGVSPASVLRVVSGGGAWAEYYTPEDLGLDPNDDIDALQIWSPYVVIPGMPEPGPNDLRVVFSLSPNSPSLMEPGTGFTWSPADLFMVQKDTTIYPGVYPGINSPGDMAGFDNRCWMHAEYLSLDPNDNLDALQIILVDPEAGDPSPSDGTLGADISSIINWRPGYGAVAHDVYFGTDFNDVNDANTVSFVYMGSFSDNSYDPGPLAFCTMYYWRIDPVIDGNTWIGDVWSFRTVSELGEADFDCSCRIDWLDLSCMAHSWLGSYEPIGPLQDGIPDECESFDFTDLDSDGITNFHDFALMLSEWFEECDDGCTCSENNYDLSGDGMVTMSDLVVVLSCIGTSGCPPEADYICDGIVDQADADHMQDVLNCFGAPFMGTNEEAQACCEQIMPQ